MNTCPHCSEPTDPGETHCLHCFHEIAAEPVANTLKLEIDSPTKPPVPNEKSNPSRTKNSSTPKAAAGKKVDQKQKQKSKPKSASDADVARKFRPVQRSPIAELRIYDDDGESYESVRIRKGELTIGRTQGDVVIPNDHMMSAEHAKIVCELVDDSWRWFLVDLGSTNGSYLRFNKIRLEHNAELLLGAFSYRFDAKPGQPGAAVADRSGLEQGATTKFQMASPTIKDRLATLIRLNPDGNQEEFPLNGKDVRVGSVMGASDTVIPNDPLTSRVHARFYRDEHQRWFAEDLRSLNGSWVRFEERRIDIKCNFQLGEQRFGLRFP